MEYRLNKYISSSGFCSRREADKYIEAGGVTIDGRKASIGDRVYPGQKVGVNGFLIEKDIEPVYIAFNKPVGVVSTTDPHERENMVDFIRHEQRIFPIGRLDKDSQGLILLTNDGDIVNKILRAGNNHKKDYIVTVNRPITDDFLSRMAKGVPILDRVTRKCELEQINPHTFKITLIQGLNRQIRRMCEYFGYEVTKLERTQIMNIKLGKLGQGNWRELTREELKALFDLLENSEKVAPEKEITKKKKDLPANQGVKFPANKTYTAAEAQDMKRVRPTRKKKADYIAEANDKGEVVKPKVKKEDTNTNPTNKKVKSKPKTGTGKRIGKQRPSKLAPKPKKRY